MCTIVDRARTESFLAEWKDGEVKTFWKLVVAGPCVVSRSYPVPVKMMSPYYEIPIDKGDNAVGRFKGMEDVFAMEDVRCGFFHCLLLESEAKEFHKVYCRTMSERKDLSMIPIQIKKDAFRGIGIFGDDMKTACVVSLKYTIDPQVYEDAVKGKYLCAQS